MSKANFVLQTTLFMEIYNADHRANEHIVMTRIASHTAALHVFQLNVFAWRSTLQICMQNFIRRTIFAFVICLLLQGMILFNDAWIILFPFFPQMIHFVASVKHTLVNNNVAARFFFQQQAYVKRKYRFAFDICLFNNAIKFFVRHYNALEIQTIEWFSIQNLSK